MPGASSKMSDPITDETGLDALFAQLMAPAAQGTGSVGADKLGTKAKAPKARSVRAERKLPEDDPWKELSDQVSDLKCEQQQGDGPFDRSVMLK